MTNILTKIIKANQEYEILGWGSSSAGEEHEVITQAAYDALTPAQKAEKVYMIKESGTPAPSPTPGSIDSFNRFITNQPLATYTSNTTIAEEDIPEWASFFCWTYYSGSAYDMWSILPLKLVKDNHTKTYHICSDRWTPSIRYTSWSYEIQSWGGLYLF